MCAPDDQDLPGEDSMPAAQSDDSSDISSQPEGDVSFPVGDVVRDGLTAGAGASPDIIGSVADAIARINTICDGDHAIDRMQAFQEQIDNWRAFLHSNPDLPSETRVQIENAISELMNAQQMQGERDAARIPSASGEVGL